MRPDIVPGSNFPDYELPDHRGKKRKLSQIQRDDPMILILSRGYHCPKERRQLMRLVDFYPELKVGYARIALISNNDLLATNEFRDGLGAQWPFLSDPGKKVMTDLDIPEYTDPIHKPMAPYTLVLEPGLKVYKIYNGYWYWGRPSVEELRQDLRDITRKIRLDWDIFDPQLRAAWKAGDKSKFWPYGKSHGQVFAEED